MQDPGAAALMGPEHEQVKCPRCDSSNTKFCYYNNYNLSQPRHLCKSCRRYWTRGGTLRNIPFGGAANRKRRHSDQPPGTSSLMKMSSANVSLSDGSGLQRMEMEPSQVERFNGNGNDTGNWLNLPD